MKMAPVQYRSNHSEKSTGSSNYNSMSTSYRLLRLADFFKKINSDGIGIAILYKTLKITFFIFFSYFVNFIYFILF